MSEGRVILHDEEGFAGVRAAGALAADALDMLGEHVRPGVPTSHFDELTREFAAAHNAIPAPLNYRGFPAALCASVNHVACHGIPSSRRLRDGDIVNLDVTLIVDGWHGDTSRTFVAGRPSRRAERLLSIASEALRRGVGAARAGARLGDVGHAIQSYVEPLGCSIAKEFCGHGLGRGFHEPPNVMHFGRPGTGLTLRPGMIFTIEPIVNSGGESVKILSDGWTAVTRDRSLSAQFEHTVGITETGTEIFTFGAGEENAWREHERLNAT